MLRRKLTVVFLLYAIFLPGIVFGQTNTTTTPTTTTAPAVKIYTAPKETIDRIREEGTKNSQVMQTLSYLTDVIGGRLTNSPNMKRANEWTRDQMAKWGMQARLESFGPWGRGWSLKSFNAQVVAPQSFPVIAYPKAWTTSTKGAVTADVVAFSARTEADLEKFKGKLSGKIVLVSPIRELKAEDKPLSVRHSDEDLRKMAEATSPNPQRPQPPQLTEEQREKQREEQRKQFLFTLKRSQFLLDEGAAVLVDNSFLGSGGTLFVQGATVTAEVPADISTFNPRAMFQPYKKENEARIIPQMTMATEDYNRLVRMINLGVTPRMTVDIQAQYHDEDQMGYNTIAEIPGTDPALKDEVVMLGGHLDSWHSSTGATDNAAGCAVAMEAARIILASGLKPRRTIRVALWSGEEQGLNGSREYVKQHFGETRGGGGGGGGLFGGGNQTPTPVEIVKGAHYEKLSAYYNLDNGTGKIRGVYMQGNRAVEPIFRAWLAPFADMGANTVTILNTGGTDHLSFDRIGLPGFQFIQDEVEYDTRTHHSNQDNYDRLQADDMKQASIIMAAFVYQTAMMDEKIPRKPATVR
ncbi:MAG: M20/M25/M40 family metallo-hydrolase [Acidobacteriota bacterium]|nr:M20/M25/M40 family metallo-hydrolase [Acidobacteriota bacterium]